MKTVNSLSGGQTSAYLAAKFPADYNIFSLVRIEDEAAKFPDAAIRKLVEDKIQKPFIATAEDDKIIYTMLDLEQFLGREIHWVSGITFDEVIKNKGGWLPNKLHRYCTTHMKIEPMFYWWAEKIGEPVEMRIGFRANEGRRKKTTIEKLNENGLLTFKGTFEKNSRGQNKWEEVEWQKPAFPLIDVEPTYKDEIQAFWSDKPVRFAQLNNCVGCFHRNPLLLKKQFDEHPEKMDWFNRAEKWKTSKNGKATWRSDVTYERIKNFQPQFELNFEDFDECDSGYCGL
jgi:hypothetical protein